MWGKREDVAVVQVKGDRGGVRRPPERWREVDRDPLWWQAPIGLDVAGEKERTSFLAREIL